ncbi:C40 family peptidase, partial [Gordonibacter massiliensis (ex Traore et al. 2017)]|uniref:C40 family peptidase n=1 Tax=Gordonibacter massiliensis (ex Traore et al. 2017) TaxID=1841863 RepID=UPI001C8C16D9
CSGYFSVDGANYFGLGGQGYVLRGKASWGSVVLLADNDGKMVSSSGWLVTKVYDSDLQRYWIIQIPNQVGYFGAQVGYFTAVFEGEPNSFYGQEGQGYVVRGKMPYGNGVLLADNDGRLAVTTGWLVTDRYDGRLERYYLDFSCFGHIGAHVGMIDAAGQKYYGLPDVGYVMRNATSPVDGYWYDANNDGALSLVSTRAIRLGNGTYLWIDASGRENRQDAINRLMAAADSVLGVPYVWLGRYPEDGGMDCASFTYWCYRQLGITIDFETYGQVYDGRGVSLSEAAPGDLILMYFSSPGVPEHVVMYAGNGMIYEEPTFGGHCQYVPLSAKNAGYVVVRRILA